MKVYVFGTRGFPKVQGGVEKHCEHLYPLLAKEFEINLFRRKAYITKGDTQTYPNIKFIDLPSTKIKGFEAFYHSFLCTIYCLFVRPDLVHVHNIGPGIFIPLLKLFGLKVILTYHSPNYEHKKWGKFAQGILRIGEKLATKYSDTIIFVNKNQLNKFDDSKRKKSVFIPNGIVIKPKINFPHYILELGLEPYQYILTVGRITQEKGFDYLIDAFISLHTDKIKLVIAGGMDHKSDYAKKLLAKADESIIFAGHVENERLQELYSFARLFVLPSYNEGYPLVLLEAISYNLPILASDISGNKQIELPSENYFKVGSIDALVEKISDKLTDKSYEATYNVKLYTWDKVSVEVSAIYNRILAHHNEHS